MINRDIEQINVEQPFHLWLVFSLLGLIRRVKFRHRYHDPIPWIWDSGTITYFQQASNDWILEKTLNSAAPKHPLALSRNLSILIHANEDSIHLGTFASPNLGLFHNEIDPERVGSVMLSPSDQTSSSKGPKSTRLDTLATQTTV